MGLNSMNVMGARPQSYRKGHSDAYETGRLIRPNAGTLIALFGYNSGPDQFIHIIDKKTEPEGGEIPDIIIPAFGSQSFYALIPVGGWPVDNGIAVCNSSTGPTTTPGAADCWFSWIECN